MANPPFNPDETIPGNSGVVSIFPSQERTFRDIIESWLLWEHDRSGYHAFDMDTTTNRDADSTRPAGSIFFNTTLDVLQFLTAISPSPVWDTISFPAGTRMLFQQTSAPPGWTKVTDAAYSNAAVRIITTGSVATGGDVAFTDAFKEHVIDDATEPHTLTTAELPNHSHPIRMTNAADDGSGSGGILARNSGTRTNYTFTGTPTDTLGQQLGGAGSGQAHSHDIELTLDIAVKYADFILCEKD